MNKFSKKILIISYQFPPDTGSIRRVLDFVKYLPENNWNPVILTHESKKDGKEDIDKNLSKDGVKIYRIGCEYNIKSFVEKVERTSSNLLKSQSRLDLLKLQLYKILKLIYQKIRDFIVWPDKWVWWVPFAIIKGSKIIKLENIKTVYVVTPPHSATIIGYILKIFFRVNLVLDFRDPWANDVDIVMPTSLHKFMHRKIEKTIVRAADAVITTTSFHTAYFRSILPKKHEKKVFTITNGVDLNQFELNNSTDLECFTIIHAGNFDPSRSPRGFLEAISSIDKNFPNIFGKDSVRLYGNINPLVADYIEEYKLGSIVHQMGIKPYDEIVKIISEAAILLLVVHNDPSTPKYCIPAKLFEYMATGRPIIAISPKGAAAEIIDQYQLGVVISHNNVKQIESVILEYYDSYVSGSLVTKIPEKKILEKFDRKGLTKQLAKILDNLN
jgi:glycosyltransferase involved in cell wall biosynthesis